MSAMGRKRPDWGASAIGQERIFDKDWTLRLERSIPDFYIASSLVRASMYNLQGTSALLAFSTACFEPCSATLHLGRAVSL